MFGSFELAELNHLIDLWGERKRPVEWMHDAQGEQRKYFHIVSQTWCHLHDFLTAPCVASVSAAQRTMKMKKRLCTWAMQSCHFIQLL